MVGYVAHLLFPRSSNNYRARLLHHIFLLAFISVFVVGGFFLGYGRTKYPSVLGVSSDITIGQLLADTNQKRAENGLQPLSLDSRLSQAAAGKAMDMFGSNYWAHNSPDGKTPWVFIRNAGYGYIYAGENLARGFSSSGDVVSAWMASPDHRKNLLSSNFVNIGFAVEKGRLSGEETVLVVQMFGSPAGQAVTQVDTVPSEPVPTTAVEDQMPTPTISAQNNTPAVITQVPEPTKTAANDNVKNPQNQFDTVIVAGAGANPKIDSKIVSRNVAVIVVLGFILIFILDIILIEKRKALRFVGHNLDHVIFLFMIVAMILILVSGSII